MNRLCYEHQLKAGAETQYILVDFVSDMEAFRAAMDILRPLQKNVDRIKYVETAYKGFLNLKESMREYTQDGQIKLEIAARSFFTEFDVFLNHWEKRISCHPRKKEFRKLYDQLTHEAFDSSEAYAMAVIIRNYAIHAAGIINGTIWGNGYYDVSIWKQELMRDNTIPPNKKKVVARQSSEFILLQPIMESALEKLKEIQEILVGFLIDEETRNAANTVANEIKKIKEYGDKRWFFTNDEESSMNIDDEGHPVKYIKGKCLEVFNWKELDELIESIELERKRPFLRSVRLKDGSSVSIYEKQQNSRRQQLGE